MLRYGIPDFKLEKQVLDRRIDQMRAEGVSFKTNVNAGVDLSGTYLKRSFDAIVLAAGSRMPRDLKIPGRDLEGIHFAMDFLSRQNRINADDAVPSDGLMSATGKNVLVIGGGDTGSDCVGTSRRQGAKNICQVEILPKPPETRPYNNPWPDWPMTMRTSSSQEEGCERIWSVLAKECIGNSGSVAEVRFVRIEWTDSGVAGEFREIPDSEFTVSADFVLLSMGFLHVEHGALITGLNLERDERGNVAVDTEFMTSEPGVFAAGDSVVGASLVVRAIKQGRDAAEAVDRYLSE